MQKKPRYFNSNNPRNPASNLFKVLTRIFSGPIVSYRRETEKSLSKKKLDKYNFFSPRGESFKKGSNSPFKHLQFEVISSYSRSQRYADFTQMEYYPELASALDIYADEMTTYTKIDPMLRIDCSNQVIKEILETLYYKILNIEFNMFGWCRNMCKYGDYFMYLDIDEDGVKNVIGLPPEEVERMEGQDETNPNYVQFVWNTANVTFENWQIAHFRILGNDKYAPYGSSTLDSARRIWRQLSMLEDAMMSYRIVRAPERRAWYVDVGHLPPNEVEQFMQMFVTSMKRGQIVDATSGKVDERYNPMSTEEDFYIPVRGSAQSTRVEPLPGGQYTGDIEDVKYLRDKLFAAIKIPMSYLVRGEGASEDQSSLAAKDIRFSRTIQRLQRSAIAELEKIGIIHLYTLGFRGEDLLSFSLALNNPSKIAELQDLEEWKTKFDVASSATDGYFSRRWIAKKLFGMSEEEFLKCQREMYYDKWFDAQLDSISEGGASAEGDGGGLGGDLDLGGEGEDLGTTDEEMPEEEMPEDGELLAAPGKRDEPYLTRGSNGKLYKPVVVDKRPEGARTRHFKSKFGSEIASNTPRNVFRGYSKLKSLANGIAENKEEEVNVTFAKEKVEIESLIEQLDTCEDSISNKKLSGRVKKLVNTKKDEKVCPN